MILISQSSFFCQPWADLISNVDDAIPIRRYGKAGLDSGHVSTIYKRWMRNVKGRE